MSRTLRPILVCLAAVAVLAGAARFVVSGIPTRAPIVATIDIERLFGGLDLLTTQEQRVDAVAGEFDTQLETLRGRIEELQAELENFEEGGEAWLGVNQSVEQTISEYRAIEQFGKLKVEAERSKAMRAVYEAMKANIAEFAASQTPVIDYVLIDDTIPELEPSTADAMQKQISARRMIYSTNSFDITDIILARMNGKAG
ncbi:MAG: OmpH family outer membrane protein [Phycisphaera sp.]|nr:OmpH family outer membrane protein [Phycisphaera sp.]